MCEFPLLCHICADDVIVLHIIWTLSVHEYAVPCHRAPFWRDSRSYRCRKDTAAAFSCKEGTLKRI